MKAAQDYLKSNADIAKTKGEAGKDVAQTAKYNGEVMDATLKRYRSELDTIADPQSAARWLQAQYQDPAIGQFMASKGGPFEQAVRSIPTDPEGFAKWRGMAGMGMEKFIAEQRMQAQQAEVARHNQVGERQTAANDIMMPDGKGGFVPNRAYIGAKASIAKSGASNINISTDKSLLTTMAKGLGEQLDTGLAGANSAAQTIQNAQNLKGLLNNGKLITGPGADTRILLTQIGSTLGVGGKDDAEKLANTRLAMQAMARSELDAAQSMKGQGAMSDNERALVKRAAGGDINMTSAELSVLADGLEKSGRARIKQHQTNVQRLGSVKGAETLMPFYQVEMPPEAPKAPAKTGAGPDVDSLVEKYRSKK
jgi:hypothetical protein